MAFAKAIVSRENDLLHVDDASWIDARRNKQFSAKAYWIETNSLASFTAFGSYRCVAAKDTHTPTTGYGVFCLDSSDTNVNDRFSSFRSRSHQLFIVSHSVYVSCY